MNNKFRRINCEFIKIFFFLDGISRNIDIKCKFVNLMDFNSLIRIGEIKWRWKLEKLVEYELNNKLNMMSASLLIENDSVKFVLIMKLKLIRKLIVRCLIHQIIILIYNRYITFYINLAICNQNHLRKYISIYLFNYGQFFYL